MAYLIVLRDRAVFDRRELTRPLTFGRGHDCDVVIPDLKASRRHCAIEPTPDGGWQVRDLGSRNGTLKGEDLITEAPLANGDMVWLGENVCIQFSDGPMPRRRPEQPHEALELARADNADDSEDKRSPEPPTAPRPMPRAWDSTSESSPADVSAVSTDLNFGKKRGTPAARAAGR
jgi:pSer/pThr/pTyr-binding forkhead associated (FHA) protein